MLRGGGAGRKPLEGRAARESRPIADLLQMRAPVESPYSMEAVAVWFYWGLAPDADTAYTTMGAFATDALECTRVRMRRNAYALRLCLCTHGMGMPPVRMASWCAHT